MTRPMEHVSSGLEKIVADSLRHAPAGQGPVLAWPLACGPTVAGRTRPLDFQRGVLRVEVPDAGWRAELRCLAPQYLAVMNRYVVERVERIEFVVGASGDTGGARRVRE
jgi:predicted nucleic acid-binding Zn ribbon protein